LIILMIIMIGGGLKTASTWTYWQLILRWKFDSLPSGPTKISKTNPNHSKQHL